MSADLSNSGLSDLSSLDVTSLSLPLSRLTLSNNHLTQLSHLRPFTSLEELHVENNEITNLTDGVDGIALLTQLKVLVLAGNKLKEIHGLENLKALQYLDISHNQISRLDGLSSNTSLAYLDASHNNISELSDLSKLTSLQTLNLDDNVMSSLLTAVNHLPGSLTVLSLAGNRFQQLHNFTFLTKLEQLTTLDVSGNPFLEESYQQRYDFRPFLLFLLPRLTDLAGRVVSTQEWQLSQTLFTDSSGSFDNDLIELLRPDRASGLIQYLIQRCPLSDVEVAQRRAADAKQAQAAQQAQEERPTLGKKQPSIEVAKHQPRGVDRTEDADADAADNDIDAILARAQNQAQVNTLSAPATGASAGMGHNAPNLVKFRGSQSLLSPSSKQLEKERSKMGSYPSLSDNSAIDITEYHAMQKMVHDLTRYMKLVMRKIGDQEETKGEQMENPTVAELMLDLQETKAALIATQEKVMHQDNAIRVLWEEVRRLRIDSASTSSSGTGTAATPTQFNTPMFRPQYPLGGADGDDPNLPFMPSVVSFSDGRQELSINNNSSPEASKRHSRAPSYTYQFPSGAVPQAAGSSNLSAINAMALQHAVQSYAHSPAGAPTPQSTPIARPLAASVGAAPSPMHSRNVSYTFPNMAPAQGQTGVLSHMSQAAMAAALAGLAQQQGGNAGSSGTGAVSHTPPPSPFVAAGQGMPTFNYGSLHVGSANSTAPPTPAQTPSQHHSFSFPSTAAPSPVVGASQSFGFPPPSPQFLSMSYPAGSAPSPSPPPTPSFGPSLAQAPDREKGSLHTPPTTPQYQQSFVWPSPRSSITALTAQLPPNINQPGAYAAPTPTARSSLSVNVGQGGTPFVPSPSPSPLMNPAPTPMPTPSHSGLHPHGRSTSFSSLPSLNSLSGLSPSPSFNSLQQGQFMIMLTPTNASSMDEQGQLVGTQDFWSASPRSSISSSASSPPFASPRTSLSINTVTGTSGHIDFNGAESPAHAMNSAILGSSSGLPPPHGHHQHNNSLSSFPTINPSFSFLPPTHPPSTPVQAPTPASTPIHTGLSGHPRAPQNTPTAQSGSFNYPHSRAPSLSSIPSFSPLLQSPAGSAPSSTPNTPTFTSSHPFRFHHSPTLPTIDAHSTLHHSLSNQFISQSPSSGRHISFDSNDSEDEEPQARQRQQALLKDAVHQALGHGHKAQKGTSTIVENEAEDEHDTFNTDRLNKPRKDEERDREAEEDVLAMPRVSVRTQSFESIASPLHGPSPVTASPLLKSNGGRQ